jgi:hypothetical protein
LDTVNGLKKLLRNPACHKGSGPAVFSQLIYWEDAIANEFRLGAGEIRENKTRAIAKNYLVTKMDGLEMLGLAGGRRNRDFLGSNERIDC